MTDRDELPLMRSIDGYLMGIGLFSPEHPANHGDVRHLLIDCRAHIRELTEERDQLQARVDALRKAIGNAQFAMSGHAPPEFNSAGAILFNAMGQDDAASTSGSTLLHSAAQQR